MVHAQRNDARAIAKLDAAHAEWQFAIDAEGLFDQFGDLPRESRVIGLGAGHGHAQQLEA